jgi:hypothetical protein
MLVVAVANCCVSFTIRLGDGGENIFQEFSPFFGPDDLDAMNAAFDAVWQGRCNARLNPSTRQESLGVCGSRKEPGADGKSRPRTLPRRAGAKSPCRRGATSVSRPAYCRGGLGGANDWSLKGEAVGT